MEEISKSEQIDSILKCSENLDFVRQRAASSQFSKRVKQELEEQIERVKRRLCDENLYLAVVGEFSSGKSTFINALLGEDLLKTSSLVATATETKIQYGNNLSVEAQLSEKYPNRSIKLIGQEKVNASWLSKGNGLDTRDFLHLVTSDEDLSKDVLSVTIEYPSSFLSDGIVVFDTPGTNADCDGHSEITQRVVMEQSDSAIVIIPATSPLTQSLVKFLTEFLADGINRCIFVVTRMDSVQANEREKLLENIRARLSEILNTSFEIYDCCAQAVIDSVNNEDSFIQESESWLVGFQQLKKVIHNRLNRERIVHIAGKVSNLLNDLLIELEENLRFKQEQYNHRQSEIEAEIIPDLQSFTSEQHKKCTNLLKIEVESRKANLIRATEAIREKTTSKLHSIVFSVDSEETLKTALQSEVSTPIQDSQDEVQKELEKALSALESSASHISKSFDDEFRKVYKRLELVAGDVVNTSLSQQEGFHTTYTQDAFTSAVTLTKKFDSEDGTKIGLGAGAGALIGTFIFPGIGTAIGSAVGWGVSKLFMPSLNERKDKIWNEISPKLVPYFSDMKGQSIMKLEAHANLIDKQLISRIDSHLSRYENIVREILERQEKELDNLEKIRIHVRSDLGEIQRRREQLSNKVQSIGNQI